MSEELGWKIDKIINSPDFECLCDYNRVVDLILEEFIGRVIQHYEPGFFDEALDKAHKEMKIPALGDC